MSFLFINKTLQLKNSKARTAMNAKISLFVIYVEAIIHFLLYHLYDCTFKTKIYLKVWHSLVINEPLKMQILNISVLLQLYLFQCTESVGWSKDVLRPDKIPRKSILWIHINYFCKLLHLRSLTGFWIRFCDLTHSFGGTLYEA